MSISLGFSFVDGEQITPAKMHRLVDEAVITGLNASNIDTEGVIPPTYGTDRPSASAGRIHYDTTPGIEGLYFSFVSPSNASLASWLCAMPRRECLCYASSAVSAYTPVFHIRPAYLGYGVEWIEYDGSFIPKIWEYSSATGCQEGLYITLESAQPSQIIRCMWAGLVPDDIALRGISENSGCSIGNPLYIQRDGVNSDFHSGGPLAQRSWVYGVHTLNSPTGHGALIWSGCPVISDYR